MSPRICFALVFLLAASAASAAQPPSDGLQSYYSAGYIACLAVARGVRPIEHCTAQEIALQRQALDARYRGLLASRRGDERIRLVAGERAWDARTQAHCILFSRRRGSLNSMKAQACFLDETIRRRAQLERMSGQ
jgi:uncharacterized protein YecT (DUF1311 family)